MNVTFSVNLGSRDAVKFGVDYKRCLAGETVDLADETAKALCGFGVCDEAESPAKKTTAAKPQDEPKK